MSLQGGKMTMYVQCVPHRDVNTYNLDLMNEKVEILLMGGDEEF